MSKQRQTSKSSQDPSVSGPAQSLLLQRLLDPYPEPALMIDSASLSLLAASSSARHALGYTAAELVHKPVQRLLPGGLPQCGRTRRRVQVLNGQGESLDAEARCLEFAGEGVYLVTLRLRQPAPEDSAALHSNVLFNTLFEYHDAVMMLVDPADRRVVDVNHAAVRFYGYDRDQLRGMDLNRLNILEPEAISRELQRAQQEAQNYFVFSHRLASGEVRSVEVHSSPVEVEGRRLLFSVVHDITERRRIEHNLAHSEALYRSILEGAADAVLVAGVEGHYLYANPSATELLGYDRNELLGMGIDDVVADDCRHRAWHEFRQMVASGSGLTEEYRLVRKDGCTVEVEVNAIVLPGGNVYASCRDISVRREMLNAVLESQQRFETLVQNVPGAVYRATAGDPWQMLFLSDGIAAIAGYQPRDLVGGGRVWGELVVPEDLLPLKHAVERAIRWRQGYDNEYRIRHADGSIRWVRGTGRPVFDDAGQVLYLDGLLLDVTDQVRNRQALQINEAQLKAIFEQASVGVALVDAASDRYLRVNQRYRDISGLGERALDTLTFRDLTHPDDLQQDLDQFAALTSGELLHYSQEKRFLREDGSWVWTSFSVTPLWAPGETPTQYITVVDDISERKLAEQRLNYMAHYDPLTGLGNRSFLNLRLEHAVEQARRHDMRIAVLFIDLDRFKNVNDSLGHPLGDEVLVSVARLLKQRLRQEDTLVRLGGDEFLVVLENMGAPEQAAILARDLIHCINQPLMLSGQREVYVGCSIGISLFPEDANDVTQLVSNADAALYQAKRHGGNSYHFYTRSLTEAANERLEMEARLRRALEREEFLLHYQPVVDVATGAVVGAEALVRWRTEEGELVPPGRFIPVAEETGLIVELGDWVLRRACLEVCEHFPSVTGFRLAVNLSMRQLERPQLVTTVSDILRDTGFPPKSWNWRLPRPTSCSRADWPRPP